MTITTDVWECDGCEAICRVAEIDGGQQPVRICQNCAEAAIKALTADQPPPDPANPNGIFA